MEKVDSGTASYTGYSGSSATLMFQGSVEAGMAAEGLVSHC